MDGASLDWGWVRVNLFFKIPLCAEVVQRMRVQQDGPAWRQLDREDLSSMARLDRFLLDVGAPLGFGLLEMPVAMPLACLSTFQM